MNRATQADVASPVRQVAARAVRLFHVFALCLIAAALTQLTARAQITIDTRTGTVNNSSTGQAAPVDRRFAQIKPTHVPLPNSELDQKSRLMLIRLLQSEQGFAMRPFPGGHKGLTLAANGKLEPAGESYLQMVTTEGMAAKPGDRLIITDLKVEKSHIVFELNGGPEGKHRYLRHISVGGVGDTAPIVRDQDTPVGARLTLTFDDHIPAITGQQVKALLAPLISFDVKTPIQAFTDTLPPTLKDAILNHHVLVGMSTEMLLFAKGQPDIKYHEIEGNMPFDSWVYGTPPQDVEFVRINGNRVIRVEIAKIGKTPVVYTKDEVAGLMRTDGSPLTLDAGSNKPEIQLGDVARDPNTQAPAPPPTLGGSGSSAQDNAHHDGVMKPVVFPKPKPETQPGANPDGEPEAQPASSPKPAPAAGSQPAPQPQPSAPSQQN